MKKIIFFLIICEISFAQIGAKYLIITHNDFLNAIQPLAQWKHKKGLPTKVVALSELNATPESLSAIKRYIVNAYNTWNPRPEYVLLVGSPLHIKTDQNKYDDYYANLTGDYKMEISLGRFSCSTAVHCSTMVAKTLSYERNPYMLDTLWYKKGTGIVREDFGAVDSVYWQNMRYIFGLWQNANFIHIDSFSRQRQDSARHVISAIDDGRTFVVFRGQGVGNWWSPFTLDPYLCNNNYKLPIVISGTCATINLSYLEPHYLGESFLRAGSADNPKGAVAFVGTTNSESGSGLAEIRGTVTINIAKAIFSEGVYKLGDAVKRGKFLADSIRPSGWTSIRYREWNLLGDPELSIWTDVPKTLSVFYDSVISPSQTNISCQVKIGTTPLANALVCIMKDTIYRYGLTNTNGIINFTIPQQNSGMFFITVTAKNCKPFEGTIRVSTTDIKESADRKNLLSNIQIYPNPCRDVVNIKGLMANLPVSGDKWQIAIYDVQGRQVLNANCKEQNEKLNISNLASGIYMIVIRNEKARLVQKLVIR
ncbi:MAG: C25 family cysteine peptidase [candidate division WOR-3 bacterium]